MALYSLILSSKQERFLVESKEERGSWIQPMEIEETVETSQNDLQISFPQNRYLKLLMHSIVI